MMHPFWAKNAVSCFICRSLDYSGMNSLQCHEPFKCEKKTFLSKIRAIFLFGYPNKEGTVSEKKDQKQIYHYVPRTTTIFPQEIITEFLLRLPVKVLVKLQLVCKQWYVIIQDRHFIESYMKRGPVIRINNKMPSTPSTHETFQLICECDGLLLRKSSVTHKYDIINPTTREILELPDPKKTEIPMTFDFVRSTNEYKLVSTYDDVTGCNGAFCEVLTVGSDKSWRPLKIQSLNDVHKKWDNTMVRSTDSAVHWGQLYKVGSKFSIEVVSLDLGTEYFTSSTLPNNLYPYWERIWALNWGGKLGLGEIVKGELQVLVLEDYKKQKWSKKKTVIQLSFINKNEYLEADLAPLAAENDTVWFWLKNNKVFSYNMKSGCIGRILVTQKGSMIPYHRFELPPSLVTFKGMKTEKKLLNQQG